MESFSGEESTIRSLIVDDDANIGVVLKELIFKESVSVDVFTDSQMAVASLSRKPVDIVITDLMMGEIGGLEVLRCAKKANEETIVIIITGHASLETAIEAVRQGAYDYIKKPFKLREIEIVFEKAVEKVRLVQHNKALLRELNETRAQLAALEKQNQRAVRELEQIRRHDTSLRFIPTRSPSLAIFQDEIDRQNNLCKKLEKIVELKKNGFLSEDEFRKMKERMLDPSIFPKRKPIV